MNARCVVVVGLIILLGYGAQGTASGQGLPPGLTAADLVKIANNRAIEEKLAGMTQSLTGQWVDTNGNAVGLTVVEGLLLKQSITMQQLQIARNNAVPLQTLTPAQKDQLLTELRKIASDIVPKYDAFQQLQAAIDDVPGSTVTLRETYNKQLGEVAKAEERGDSAEANRLRESMAGSLYGRYLRARDAYYRALSVNPLMAVQLTPGGRHFFEALLLSTSSSIFEDTVDKYINQLSEQIDRISKFDTVAELWELAGPMYLGTNQAMVQNAGTLGALYVNALDGAYGGAKAIGDYNKAFYDTMIAIGQAIPVAGAVFTGIAIYRQGSEYVVALTDEANAKAMASVTGYQGVIQAGERAEAVGQQLFVSVALAPAEIPGLVQAIKTGKNLIVTTKAANAAEAAKAAEAARAAAAAKTATGIVTTADEFLNGLTNDAKAGVRKARELGLANTDNAIATLRAADSPKGYLGTELMFDNIGSIDRAVNAAKAAGVPAETIQAILSEAQKLKTVQAYGEIPGKLAQATFQAEGKVLLTPGAGSTGLQVPDFVTNAFAGSKIPIYATEYLRDLLKLKTEVMMAVREGRLPQLLPEQVRLLNEKIIPNGDKILKWYSLDPSTFEVEAIFDQAFLNDLRTSLERSAAGGNQVARQALAKLDWATLESKAATSVTGAGGAATGKVDLLSMDVKSVAGLTTKQLQDIPPQVFDLLPSDVREAIANEISKRGLPPKVGISPGAGILALDPERSAQRFADLAKKLNKEQLQQLSTQLAKDAKANAQLKTAIANELKAREGAANLASNSGAGAIKPGDYTAMDGSVREQMKASGINAEGWTYKPNGMGGFTYLSPDGKTSVDATYSNGNMIVGQPYVTPAAPNAAGAGAATSKASNMTGNAAAAIKPGDYTSMDYSVREQLNAAGINTTGWTYKPNNTGGFTYTSADGKTSVDAVFLNGKMIVGQPYVTPASSTGGASGNSVGSNTPAGGGGGLKVKTNEELAKDLCERAAFWREEAAKARGYSAAATNPIDKARFDDMAHFDENNAKMRERWAGEYGYPCPPPNEANTIGGGPAVGGGGGAPESIDLAKDGGTATGLGGAKPNGKVQLIIITAEDGKIAVQVKSASNVNPSRDGARPTVVAYLRSPFAWLARASRVTPPSLSKTSAVPSWEVASLPLAFSTTQPASGQPSVSIVATGASTGDVFDMQVVSPDGRPVQVNAPEGLVLEAVEPPSSPRTRPSSRAQTARQMIEGYCLEFMKPPPAAGMLYRVAPPAVQQRFSRMRHVLQSATALNQAAKLHADSNPKGYLQFIKQYAMWTRLENWDLKQFGEHFIDRTRQNLKNLGQNWTSEVERQVTAAIPGRWADIQRVLQEAAALEGAQ